MAGCRVHSALGTGRAGTAARFRAPECVRRCFRLLVALALGCSCLRARPGALRQDLFGEGPGKAADRAAQATLPRGQWGIQGAVRVAQTREAQRRPGQVGDSLGKSSLAKRYITFKVTLSIWKRHAVHEISQHAPRIRECGPLDQVVSRGLRRSPVAHSRDCLEAHSHPGVPVDQGRVDPGDAGGAVEPVARPRARGRDAPVARPDEDAVSPTMSTPTGPLGRSGPSGERAGPLFWFAGSPTGPPLVPLDVAHKGGN